MEKFDFQSSVRYSLVEELIFIPKSLNLSTCPDTVALVLSTGVSKYSNDSETNDRVP